MNRVSYAYRVRKWRRAYARSKGKVTVMPETVVARCSYSCTWQRILGIPYRRYIAIEIIGHGCTQALGKRDIEYMTLDYLICMNDGKTKPSDYKVVIEWN